MSARVPALIAEVTRRDHRTGDELVESTHVGHVVVVGPDGEVVASLGDPDRVTFVRSAVKVQQAKACLDLIREAGRAGELSVEDLAIGQASHRGEPRHLEAVTRLLARSGKGPVDLTTPPERSEAREVEGQSPLQHNCSGKHALFALAGQVIGVEGDELLDPTGGLQKRLLAHLEDELGPALATGTDGCGAPAIAVPLVRLAGSYQRLRLDPGYAPLVDAAVARPLLVGGEGRLESALLGVGITAKNGAEGVFAAAWTDAGGDAWAVAVKCEDGSTRGVDAATLGLLAAAGVVDPDVHQVPFPVGGGGVVGSVRPGAAVRDLGAGLA